MQIIDLAHLKKHDPDQVCPEPLFGRDMKSVSASMAGTG
jgi:hypothetical protein